MKAGKKPFAPLFAIAVSLIGGQALAADRNVVTIDDTQVFPESITSTSAGDLIIASNGKGAVYRARAGSDKATLWLDPATTGIASALGVFADDKANTLYVCSVAPNRPGTPRRSELAALRTFNLKTGAAKATYPMTQPETATCNDIDVAPDGTAYVTDTSNAQVLRLKKGGAALELWVKDQRLAGIDGIAIGSGVMYVNTVTTSRLFSIAMQRNGAAGPITELQPSLPLGRPDGMRSLGGNRFLMTENSIDVGRVTEVTVTGERAELRVMKVDPGVTAVTRVGGKVWVTNAKFAYRGNGRFKDQSPEPFTVYSIPLK